MNKSRAGIDWVAAMQEYVSTDASLRDISVKFGCHRKAVERRSALDGWSAARGRFRDSVGRRAQAMQAETRASKLKAWNDADFTLAKAIRSRVASALNKLAQPGVAVDLTELRSLASVAESTQRIGRLALGATTDNQGTILDPGEDGVAAPKLGDFYETVRFEGPTVSAATPDRPPEDDEPTRH
jgi:hypothetical protein